MPTINLSHKISQGRYRQYLDLGVGVNETSYDVNHDKLGLHHGHTLGEHEVADDRHRELSNQIRQTR